MTYIIAEYGMPLGGKITLEKDSDKLSPAYIVKTVEFHRFKTEETAQEYINKHAKTTKQK